MNISTLWSLVGVAPAWPDMDLGGDFFLQGDERPFAFDNISGEGLVQLDLGAGADVEPVEPVHLIVAVAADERDAALVGGFEAGQGERSAFDEPQVFLATLAPGDGLAVGAFAGMAQENADAAGYLFIRSHRAAPGLQKLDRFILRKRQQIVWLFRSIASAPGGDEHPAACCD